MRTRRPFCLARLVAPVLLAGALSLVACGGDDDSSGSPASTPAASADVVVAAVDGIKWDKESYSATAGDVSITLDNQSTLPHTLAIVAADGTKIGEELQTTSKGDEHTGTYTLEPATYKIICTVPGHGAMKADLVVT